MTLFNKLNHEFLFKEHDFSLWSLIITNLIIIVFAVIESWNIMIVLWLYWFQSIFIGFFTAIKIFLSKEKTELFVNGTKKNVGGIGTGLFFIFHYGFFHLIYFIFLSVFTAGYLFADKNSFTFSNILFFSIIIIFLFVNHLISFIISRKKESNRSISKLMSFPYARIIPMHFIIIFGLFLGGLALPFFLILKTLADVVMHQIEHSGQKGKS